MCNSFVYLATVPAIPAVCYEVHQAVFRTFLFCFSKICDMQGTMDQDK